VRRSNRRGAHRAAACRREVRRAHAAAAAALVPGLGHVVAGRIRTGLALLGTTAAGVGAAFLTVLALGTDRLGRMAVRPGVLLAVMIALTLLAVAWCVAIVSAYRAARPDRMSRAQATLSGALVGLLCMAVLAPAARGVQTADAARRMLHTTFGGDGAQQAAARSDLPRLRILLLGADGGPNRRGVRTDALVLVDMDTRTGRARLVSLPRNLQNVPMRPGTPLAAAYPEGFGGFWFSVYEVAQDRPELVPGVEPRYAGAAAVTDLVEHTTGVDIDYYLVADLAGFRRLIDALGGVTLDVRTGDGRPLPIGGAHAADGTVLARPTAQIPLGVQHLDGYHALWYARSRFKSSDDERQERQRCLLGALARQVRPLDVLRNVTRLAAAAEDALLTNLPAGLLPDLAEMIRLMPAAEVSGVSVRSAVGSSAHPDLSALRARIRAVLADEPLVGPVPATRPKPSRTEICPGG
jgi:LCP family protein required for cell wall assembly